MNSKLYVLTEKQLKDLLAESATLRALEWGGVDNWNGYSESIKECLKDFGVETIEDVVEDELLSIYDTMEEWSAKNCEELSEDSE